MTWSVDDGAPVVTAPTRSIATGATADTASAPVKLTWSGSDAASGIDHYELAQQTDGGGWSIVASQTGQSRTQPLRSGHTYRFRVTAVDHAGNRTTATAPSFSVKIREESSSSLSWAGTWTRRASTSFHGGALRFATARGARASLSFTGTSVSLVAALGPTRGSVRIYVDGRYRTSVSLHRASTAYRRVVYTASWPTGGAHRIELRVVGTDGHPRVDVDALVVLR